MPVEERHIPPLPLEVADQSIHSDEDPVLPIAEEHVGLASLPLARVHVHLPHPSVTNTLEKEE